VRVGVEGDPDVGVAEPLADDFGCTPACQGQLAGRVVALHLRGLEELGDQLIALAGTSGYRGVLGEAMDQS
jgi:hypothetical protein